MKQKKLIKLLNQACLEHNQEKIIKLRKKEFEKILKRRESGKSFNGHWTVVQH
jgi:hypothetical protein